MKKQVKFIAIGLLFFWVITFFIQRERIILNKNDNIGIKQYDLILTSGQSVQSKFLNLFSFSNQNYSHVGLLLKENNEIYVLHSTPDGTEENGIRYDKFQQFIDLSNVNYYRILRSVSIAENLLEKSVDFFKNKKTPFDYQFDNLDKNKIYCSELIFDIFKENGLIKTKIDLSKPIHPKIFSNMVEFKLVMERKSSKNKPKINSR